ncbi:MAG TPA: PAS domain-containing protein, partial [Verrucomicrobiae bacterium]|nr:PAS domain-containing protein [Verrucomicrobiae bacterium]
LQRIVDTAPVAIAFLDRSERFIFANGPYVERLRTTPEQVRGRTIREVLGEENYGQIARHLAVAYSGTTTFFDLERPLPGSDERRIYAMAYAPDFREDGSVGGVVIVMNDISELKLAEEDLRASRSEIDAVRRRLSSILNNAPIPIAYLDPDKRYVLVNSAYLEMLGKESGEVVGRTLQEVLPEAAYLHMAGHIDMAQEGATRRFYLEWTVPGSGERRYYVKRCAPDVDESGSVHGVVSTLGEVTDLKMAEEGLLAAKEAAESASRAKSEFLANMSHEMRTPLTGVLGMLDLVLGMQVGEEERKFLEIARRSAVSLLRLISDLLDYITLEAGKLRLRSAPFAPAEVVAVAVASVAEEAEAKGLELSWEVPPDFPPIVGDAGRVGQVLGTLLENAVKFTGEGHIRVLVTREEPPGNEARAMFIVSDTGIGIPEARMPELFQKFMQVDASSTRRYGGTGLGLALCRVLVEAMGGSIGVTSRMGEGSDFVFSIPFRPPEKC